MPSPRLAVSTLFLLQLIGDYASADPITAQADNARTGAYLTEFRLNTFNVNVHTFGKLFTRSVDGQIYAQPLYVPQIEIPGRGRKNVVYVATMHNSVYAFDADNPAASDPLWQVSLGPSVPAAAYGDGFVDIAVEVGILSTPVIDPDSQTLYAVAATLEKGRFLYRLHALDLSTGEEKAGGPTVIQARVPGFGYDHVRNRIHFKPAQQLQRPALLLLNGVVYIAFGSHQDGDPFHGWLLGYSATTLRQVAVYNVTPNGGQGSIWHSGRGPAADAEGNVYVVTSNGDWDGETNFSESFLKLSTGNTLRVADWFTPDTWSILNEHDNDLGSSGPLLIPGTNLMVSGGKEGILYVLDRGALGGCTPGNHRIVQSFQASEEGISSLAFWESPRGPVLYLWGWYLNLRAYRMVDGRFDPVPISASNIFADYPGGALSISANGSIPGTGIVWALAPEGETSVLRAFDAANVSRELWNSAENAARDGLGRHAKFVAPTIANGKVYVPTFTNQLVVYGLLDGLL